MGGYSSETPVNLWKIIGNDIQRMDRNPTFLAVSVDGSVNVPVLGVSK